VRKVIREQLDKILEPVGEALLDHRADGPWYAAPAHEQALDDILVSACLKL